jgi:predicted HTH domain antitoxin
VLLWYSHGELSQSKAAEIAGTSRAEFMDELAHRRIPVRGFYSAGTLWVGLVGKAVRNVKTIVPSRI